MCIYVCIYICICIFIYIYLIFTTTMSNNATYYEELEDPTTGRSNNNNNMKYNLVPNTNIKQQSKCCGCRRKTCIITFIVINLLIIGGFALYLFSKGGTYIYIYIYSNTHTYSIIIIQH